MAYTVLLGPNPQMNAYSALTVKYSENTVILRYLVGSLSSHLGPDLQDT